MGLSAFFNKAVMEPLREAASEAAFLVRTGLSAIFYEAAAPVAIAGGREVNFSAITAERATRGFRAEDFAQKTDGIKRNGNHFGNAR